MRNHSETPADPDPIVEIAAILARAILRLQARNALPHAESSAGDNSEKSLSKGLEVFAETVLSVGRG